ncbi:hypothetical protein HDU98_001277 [Podochytrium sp. JEL0797]|nr:hypothetical protein HDU98_001277 [Podochytrium sp. JEL0797]
MWINLFFVLLASVALAANATPVSIPTQSAPVQLSHASGPLFYDSQGRARIFRGTNVVRKGFPFHPDISDSAVPGSYDSFNQGDINFLVSMGVNTIRLGVLWAGVEPVRGQYNQTYLEVMKTIVQRCQDAGIYVLVDFHQDVLNPVLCGEGIPDWATQPKSSFLFPGFPSPLSKPYKNGPDGLPTASDCAKQTWSNYYATYAASTAFQRLYDNYDGLTDALGKYFQLLAKTFKPFNNILGYELINEPWAGDIFANPALVVPPVAGLVNLQPFYDKLAGYIRAVETDSLIFFEPVELAQVDVGFTHTPGKNPTKSVLSFHFYTTDHVLGLVPTIKSRYLTMSTLGCGGMLTEWQQWGSDAASIEFMTNTIATADTYLLSHQGWQYLEGSFRYANGSGVVPVVTANSRPYASAVAGVPMSMNYNDATGTFVLMFRDDGSAQGVTEIRTGGVWHYPRGCTVLVSAGYHVLSQAEGAQDGFVFVSRGAEVVGTHTVSVIVTRN